MSYQKICQVMTLKFKMPIELVTTLPSNFIKCLWSIDAILKLLIKTPYWCPMTQSNDEKNW